MNQISEMLETLKNNVINILKNNDWVRFVFDHPDLESPIDFPFIKQKALSVRNMISFFEMIAQSHKTLQINVLTAYVVIAYSITGRGNHPKNVQEYCNQIKSIKNVINSDNLCAIRAIVIGKAYADQLANRHRLSETNLKTVSEFIANKLDTEIIISNRELTILDIQNIEIFLKNYQITIYEQDAKINDEPLYIGPPNEKFIYLCYTGSHFNYFNETIF